MILDFFAFVIDCLEMVVLLFRTTVIDGITYETLIVASCMIGIVLTSLVIKFRSSGFPSPGSSGRNRRMNDEDLG